MAFGATRIIDYDRQPQDPGASDAGPQVKPYTEQPVIVERAPAYYRDPATVVIAGQPQLAQPQMFQFTGTQLIIGAIVLYLLLKG